MINGLIIVNKKRGTGSTDYVRMVKKLINQKKVGHSGTLDLLAKGVLVICLGKGTKIIEYIQKEKKTYIATIKFGIQTSTLDSEGDIINSSDKLVNEEEFLKIISNYVGNISQIPPMYSALKHNGKRLYDLAREGITIERKPRDTFIYSIDLENFDFANQECIIKTTVKAGTYIRTLIDDIGTDLGAFAYMKDLVRVECSGFNIEQSIDLEEETQISIQNKIIPLEDALVSLQRLKVDHEEFTKLKNGMTCNIDTNLAPGQYNVLFENKLIGIGNLFETLKGKMLKLEKHLY